MCCFFKLLGTPPSTDVAQGEYPTVVENGAHKTLVVQAMAFSKYLGLLEVNFDGAGEVSTWTGNPILLDSSIVEGFKLPFNCKMKFRFTHIYFQRHHHASPIEALVGRGQYYWPREYWQNRRVP
jgi:hypothetical protein